MQKYYIFLNLGPAAGPAQAYTIVLQLPIIETRAEVLLGLARADVQLFEFIEPAKEVSNISARYLESENRADVGNCYRIITTSIKQYTMPFIPTSTSRNSSTKCASLSGEITIRLREHMRMRITDFCAFLRFKKHIATTYSLWERAHQKTPDQHSNELTRLLIDAQLASINSLEHGPLQTGLFIALAQVLHKLNSCRLIIPICVMDSIEDVFEEQRVIKK
jgi:hypothetical protein